MIDFEQKQENKSKLSISWQGLKNLLSRNSELVSIKNKYGSALTNAGREVKLAMDSALEKSGHFNVIRNAVASGGIDIYPQFLGYSYLSGLQQNGFIRAGVEGLADEMTAKFIEIIRTADTDNNDDEKVNKINEFLNKFSIKELFNKAACFNGYFGGCLIFIDTGEDDLLSALDEKSLNNSIKGFVLIEPINTYPGRYNSSNPLSDDYFKPETWFILGREVHISRLLYLSSDEVSMLLKPAYNFYGISPAQIAADSVSHFIKDREAVSRLLHKFSLLVFKTDMGSALYNGNPEELYNRVQVLADFRDNDSIIIIDKEDEDIVTVTTGIQGITDVVRLSLELMPIMFRQPLTKFLGISPGGMNSTGESDENNWNEYVLSQCEKQFRKPLKRLIELIQWDLFGEVDRTIDFVFKIHSSNDESKEIANNKLKADTYVTLTEAGIISPEEARKVLAEDKTSGFNSIDIDNIPEPVTSGNEDIFGGFGAFDEYDETKHERDEYGRFQGSGENGKKLSNEADKKIESINIDFNKDNILPNLNKATLEEYGLVDKPVMLKKVIIDKNRTNHPEVKDEYAKEIIGNSLYNPVFIYSANPDKPDYKNFISKIGENKNTTVTLEIAETKDNYEIVNYHYLDNKGVERKRKKAETGGQASNK